jgi:hypothetical protein
LGGKRFEDGGGGGGQKRRGKKAREEYRSKKGQERNVGMKAAGEA